MKQNYLPHRLTKTKDAIFQLAERSPGETHFTRKFPIEGWTGNGTKY
ncbi:MAG: hypothetical protein SW833_06640 [Cyanobacteriota bacterium]|nr:hypothetical protein [Cyanobacteriota bacterium]